MNIRLVALLAFAAIAASGNARADFNPFGSYWDNVARAAKANDAEHVLKIVGTDGNPNQTDDENLTGMHYAAMNGNMRIAAILIRAGAKLDIKDPLGNTPLHWAVARRHADMVKLLLDSGASVDPDNKDGLTPLMIAARDGDLEILRALLAKGADVTKSDYTGRDAIGWGDGGHSAAIKQALQRALAERPR